MISVDNVERIGYEYNLIYLKLGFHYLKFDFFKKYGFNTGNLLRNIG